MILSHIVAVSRNFIIGKDNRLPWNMPADAKYFHDKTIGHVVIMGRKNYEANKGALPGRTNIVISRSGGFNPTDAIVTDSIENAMILARESGDEEVFIVGGGEIYRNTLDMADRIYITVIDHDYEGDTYYPAIDFSDYKVISRIENHADFQNPHDWTYWIIEKNRS